MIVPGLLLVLSVVLHLSGYYFLLARSEPFQYFFYLTAWWSYILFLDAISALRGRGFLVLNRALPLLALLSCAFWCLFEILNVRMENWFYINLPPEPFRRYGGYLAAFGTVIPAMHGTKELLRDLLGDIRIRPARLSYYPVLAVVTGLICLILLVLYPRYFFCLAWIFLALILDGFNYRRGYPSFMSDLEKGCAANLLSAMGAGLICGILWESWNYWNIAKWVYTVPFLEDVKIFEMPVLGYLGFLVFGLETESMVNLLTGSGVLQRYPCRLAAALLLFSLLSFPVIDRATAFSYLPLVRDLDFMDRERRALLELQGIHASYGIDPGFLSPSEQATLKVIHLKGLGMEHYRVLRNHGLSTMGGLAGLEPGYLSELLDQRNERRAAVYIKAARRFMLTGGT